jgi:hypothetical protein
MRGRECGKIRNERGRECVRKSGMRDGENARK